MNDKTNPIALVPGKSDTEIAADIRQRLFDAIQPALKILDEAVAAKFEVNFGTGPGPLGKQIVTVLKISKVYP